MDTDFNILLDSLEKTLNREIEFNRELINLSKKERNMLLNNQIDQLILINKRIEGTVSKTKQKEDERTSLIGYMKKHIKLYDKNITLSKLIRKLKEPYRTRLQEIHIQLLEAIKELHYLSEQNTSLVKSSLEYKKHIESVVTGINMQ